MVNSVTSVPRADNFRAAVEMREELSGFIPANAVFGSLGQNCNSAWYLKHIGIKSMSLPFDWIFSSPQIIAHCMSDDFRSFLDKSRIRSIHGHAAGHSLYHAGMFNHRNPAGDEKHYQYYQRCVSRFRELIRSDAPLVFVSTMLPEHRKRPGWANGFVHEFAVPANQNAKSEYDALLEMFARRPAPSRLIVVRQTTESPEPKLGVSDRSARLVEIRFDSVGANDGVRYLDPIDDALCKVLYSALCYPRVS